MNKLLTQTSDESLAAMLKSKNNSDYYPEWQKTRKESQGSESQQMYEIALTAFYIQFRSNNNKKGMN